MHATKIESLSRLFDFANDYRNGTWVYRGVSDSDYLLTPKARRLGLDSTQERRVFRAFFREAAAYGMTEHDSEWDSLAVAQHHGLPTRLLDWTENILVAAFFACRSNFDRDGAIYALKTASFYDRNISPFHLDRTAKFRPSHVTRRITAQHGLFTVHPAELRHLNVGDSKRKAYQVRKCQISEKSKEQLLWDLSRLDINVRSLFPDL